MAFDDDNTVRNILLAFAAIIVIVIVVVFVIVPLLEPETETGVPELSFNIVSGTGKASASGSLKLEISNAGDKASNVNVVLSSEAFGEVTKYFGDVSNGVPKTETVSVEVNDVDNDAYSVSLQYSCQQMNEDAGVITGTFVVIPDVRLIEVNFDKNLIGQDIDTIEQLGQVNLNFKVSSNSDKSTFSEIFATLEVDGDSHNFIISPVKIPIEPIGPSGTTDLPSKFNIQGNLTPVGTYHLHVVLYYDEYEVTSHERTFYVKWMLNGA